MNIPQAFHNPISISLRCALAALLAAVAMGLTAPAAEAPKIKVLLVTGDDVFPPHNWKEVSQATRKILEDSGKFAVKVCEDPAVLDSAAALQRYDLVYLAMYNATTPTLSDLSKANLAGFVKGGKGFVVSHLSSASFKEWPEFKQLCGRNWVMGTSGHGPRAPFKVKIADDSHPITKGLAGFEADDELYAKLQGDTPIKVLLEADSDWSHNTEPLAFVLTYGTGRVFHETLGHDARALTNPTLQQVIVRGCEWVATGAVK